MSIKCDHMKREMRFFAGSEREREPMYAIEQSQKKKTREIDLLLFWSRVESIMRGQNAACDDAQI